jgi:NADPH:quinone reductase-like Zn-dependent oxidoreductase
MVRVHASSINKGDWHAVAGRPWLVRPAFGLMRPRAATPGRDVAGVVEEVGPGVTRLAVGDPVVGELDQRAWAAWACASENELAVKPPEVAFDAAATLPVAGVTALQGLRDHGKLHAGEKVLVNGASGNVGTFAVQIARVLGAEVTAVCSTRNVETAARIGAEHVVDYTRTDFTATDERYDLVFDIAASRPLGACTRLLTPSGRYLACSGKLGRVAQVAMTSTWNRHVVGAWVAKANAADLELLMRWMVEGRIEPVIERVIGLDELPRAVREAGEGHGQGKTVVRM